MNQDPEARLMNSVSELCRLILKVPRNEIPDSLLQKSTRMIRSINVHDVNSYSQAVKTRLRQSILNQQVMGEEGQGPIVLAKFDKECEQLRRLNSSLINPFIYLFEMLNNSNNSNSIINDGNKKFIAYKPKPLEYVSPTSVYNSSNNNNNNNNKDNSLSSNNKEQRNINAFTINLQASEIEVLESNRFWVTYDIEYKLLKDLIYIFQVINTCI